MLWLPALTRTTERILNPVLGKSVVVYSRRTIGGGAADATAAATRTADDTVPTDPSVAPDAIEEAAGVTV